jgi:hypothetical protein
MKIIHFFFFILISACNSNNTIKKELKLFYLCKQPNNDKMDTLSYLNVRKTNAKDTLIYQDVFKYYGKMHTLKMTTNEFNTAIDGGQIRYQLDALGTIYSKSTTWEGYMRLQTNNDSLNHLIDRALEFIIEKKEFTNIKLDTFKIKMKTVSF